MDLLLGMTEKELRARYKHTLFGFLWLVLNPLLQMIVIGSIFTLFIREPVEHYFFHLFIGLIVWNFFSLSLTKATPSIVFERSLVKKARFPTQVIPLSIILSNVVHFLVTMALLIVPIAFLGTFTLTSIPLFMLSVGLLILFTVGLSLFTCALNVRFRDVYFFVQAILILWFYATPVIYSLTQIPRSLLWIWRLNPLTSVLQILQHAFLGAPLPGPAMLTANILVISAIAVLGIVVFQHESKYFDDWL